jgi:hypothetical protein
VSTDYDTDKVTDAATSLGNILDDMQAFTGLTGHHPTAGRFALAQWLERIVDDRRNAIVAHAEHLRIAFENMETTLKQIVQDFDDTDGENAAEIRDIDDLITKIDGEMRTWDEITEEDHENFTSNDEDDATDGDGYNDDLTTPVGEDEDLSEEDDEADEEEEEEEEEDKEDDEEDDEEDESEEEEEEDKEEDEGEKEEEEDKVEGDTDGDGDRDVYVHDPDYKDHAR